ncbi:hypothetical protein BG005_003661, partial [Podila minutissima]
SLPVLASALSFILYSYLGNELKPEIIFPALAYFTILRTPLMILPSAYTLAVDAYVAMKRIEAFMLSEEASSIPPPDPAHEFALSMKNASFKWDQINQTSTTSSTETLVPDATDNSGDIAEGPKAQDPPYLPNINLQIPRGSLVAVVGPVGSGKSSLLQAMVGNMTQTQGQVVRGANISYASQTAWIQNATIRDNILFDTPMDEVRYWRVVRACCLEADLRMFPGRDMTEIGERGVNLSGGQKARLSLARSVYFDAGIVIMDDPLSAVDAHVGKRLWEDCVLDVLQGRTRIIATHQLHVLPDVDYVICMKNGRIAEEGSYPELMAKNGDFCALMAQYGGVENSKGEEVDDIVEEKKRAYLNQKKTDSTGDKREIYDQELSENEGETKDEEDEEAPEAPQKLMTEEERESGAVKGSIYNGYLKASGWYYWALVFALFLVQQLANVMGNQWISWWSEDRFKLTTHQYIGIYAGWALIQLVLVFAAALTLSFTIVKTANSMHDSAFKRVLYSPLSFFDTTPTGRIINSRDVDTLDNVLWTTLYEFTITIMALLGTLVLIIVVFPWLTLAIVPILGLYYALSLYYRTTSREIKRLDSNMRSHLYAYFTECLTGLGTLKAYNVVGTAVLKNEYRIDLSNRPYYLSQLGARWVAMRVNFLGTMMSF